MSLKSRLAFADAEIERSLKAFESKAYEAKDFPKLSDTQALDIIARSAAHGLEQRDTEEGRAARISAMILITLSRTGRSHDDFKFTS